MAIDSDPYPTRLRERRDPITRIEPVIHGDPGQPGPLSPEHLARFERDGVLVLENHLEPWEVRPFLEDLAAYQEDSRFTDLPQVITEAEDATIRSIFGIHRLSARFDAITRDERLLGVARQLLGGDVYIHQSRLNCKAAFRGRGFDWHSDFETWHAEDGMAGMRSISVSVSLTENDSLNGPLLLMPGSHRTFYPTVGATPERYWETSLQRQRVGMPDREQLSMASRRHGVLAARGGPGTVTVFDCNTLHASSDNLSPLPRANLFCVYNSIANRLQAPFAAPRPRPEWVAARHNVSALTGQPGRSVAVA